MVFVAVARFGGMTDDVFAVAAVAVAADDGGGAAVDELVVSFVFLGTAVSVGELLEDDAFGRLRELRGGGVAVSCVSDKLRFHSTRRCSHCELMRHRISPRVMQLTSIA